jgi:hypothetical protein
MPTQQQYGIVCASGLESLDAAEATQVIYSASSVAEKIVGFVKAPCKIYGVYSTIVTYFSLNYKKNGA